MFVEVAHIHEHESTSQNTNNMNALGCLSLDAARSYGDLPIPSCDGLGKQLASGPWPFAEHAIETPLDALGRGALESRHRVRLWFG